MANANSTAEKLVIEPVAKTCSEGNPQFSAFSWHVDRFAPGHAIQANAHDIGHGVATILEMLEIDMLAKDNGDQPLFDSCDSSRLIRMAITSARLLADTADSEIDRANERVMYGPNHDQ